MDSRASLHEKSERALRHFALSVTSRANRPLRRFLASSLQQKHTPNKTAWILLAEAADAKIPTAGQALGVCWNNEDYRMNGGEEDNCNHDNSTCDLLPPPCSGDCLLTYDMELQNSADHLITYLPYYYEIYPPDAGNMPDTAANIHNMLLNLVH